MDRKRIQCLSNASQYVHIYLQPFTSYNEILVGNCNLFPTPLSFNAPLRSGPWDNRGKCYMDRKRIQCLLTASQHVPIYLQPFLRYSELLVEYCDIFRPHLCLAAPQGVTPSEFREDLDVHKTRMNGLSCDKEIMTIRSAVLIQYQRVTDGQTDRQTDGHPAYIYYVLQHS